ncbi:hypothetical protein MMC22_004494 [Lobaria immixta]|nr:hypothetical protein [Lobaria immixta]
MSKGQDLATLKTFINSVPDEELQGNLDHLRYPRDPDKKSDKVNSGPPISSDHGLSDISVRETGLSNGRREGEIEGQYDHLREF